MRVAKELEHLAGLAKIRNMPDGSLGLAFEGMVKDIMGLDK